MASSQLQFSSLECKSRRAETHIPLTIELLHLMETWQLWVTQSMRAVVGVMLVPMGTA